MDTVEDGGGGGGGFVEGDSTALLPWGKTYT